MEAAPSVAMLTSLKLFATWNSPQQADWELLADAQLAISR